MFVEGHIALFDVLLYNLKRQKFVMLSSENKLISLNNKFVRNKYQFSYKSAEQICKV